MPFHSFWALCVAAFLDLIGWSSAEAVVARRATTELACPQSELGVWCPEGGPVFHLAVQLRCEARGCGRSAEVRCEAPLRKVGPFERRLAATCR